ncbi:MAG: hypothetical protein RL701_3521, partial [Pseudomonadota bacterium]
VAVWYPRAGNRMSRSRLVYLYLCSAVLFGCNGAYAPGDGNAGPDAGGVACEDNDHDGFGSHCDRGYDCDDNDPKTTNECRSCAQPELGCACTATNTPISCFLPAADLPGGDITCREGTRYCRAGVWSGCESVHEYVLARSVDTQRVVNPDAGHGPCNECDIKCHQVVDNLLVDGGTAGGDVAFGPGGGLTLLPGDGGAGGMTVDAGPALTGCTGLKACCSTLSGVLKTTCDLTANNILSTDVVCQAELLVYCPSGEVDGPVVGCTLGKGPDSDCDGIPDVVDYPGKPIATTNNQTIFHQLDIGETGQNSLDLTFKLRNADVYFLVDMTNTMKEERDNLLSSLTTGNVINCAHLNQCCGRLTDMADQKSCNDAFAAATNQAGKADDQNRCLAEEKKYCPGGQPLDCPDLNFDGQPDNALKDQGVVGGVRCLVGSAWFGAGFTREMPIIKDSLDGKTGGDYGDRDEQVFRHLVDMTNDYTRVRTALGGMVTNGNHDDPEGGMMALYSIISGKGHYFGINRPAVPERLNATGCPPNSFGYPCFRKDAVPIIVFFTDRPHHNGPELPGDDCEGTGVGCPYNKLTGLAPGTSWVSGASESASDKVARRVPADAESFNTAYNAGDVRGKYVSLVGDTRFMVGDYPTAVVGCGAESAAPDSLIRFKVGAPATGSAVPIPINFHLTKDDAYSASLYGTWNTGRDNDPSPATEFGTVISVFRGVPSVVSTITDVGDKTAVSVASGPDSTYLTYAGKTNGGMSMPGFLGGISGCGADGATNQVLFTFRPTANARIVVDASESGFPTVVSLHRGLPAALPKNPSALTDPDRTVANTNDTFASANVVPKAGATIDGAYVERVADNQVSTIQATYTATTPFTVSGIRTEGSATISGLSATAGLYVGMALADSTDWSASPARIIAVQGDTVTMSETWNSASDSTQTSITFADSLVGCGVDPQGRDAVFKFDVATPRKVRIDTEGSTFDTVISLHDAPPPTTVTRTTVASVGATPGYAIGDVTNTSYVLSDLTTGTALTGDKYAYQQCGAAADSNDAAFTFQLSKPTRLSLAVSAAGFDPVVALFGTQPGATTTIDNSGNVNDTTWLDLGDVYGQLDTSVTGSNLSAANGNEVVGSLVGCGAKASGVDELYMFTPSVSTRVRIDAIPTGGWYPVVALFDDLPPASGVITPVDGFDASKAKLPEANCLVYSYHDPALTEPAHTYAVCPTRYPASEVPTLCNKAGMDDLISINSAAEQDFLLRTGVSVPQSVSFYMGAQDLLGTGAFSWRDGSPFTFTNWAPKEPNNVGTNRCAMIASTGLWSDVKCTDKNFYICEDKTPDKAPNEDTATAQLVPASSSATVYTGSTRRMSSDYNGATLLGSCGGTLNAGDAVFKVVTDASTSYTLVVDSAGSNFGAVLGLFEETIDAAGYKGCDAPGDNPLQYALLPSHTYYVLVKGTAKSPEGNYQIKFARKVSGKTQAGVSLGCDRGDPGDITANTASLEVDVDAKHTYYLVVDTVSGADKYNLVVHSLYRARSQVANAGGTNESSNSAVALPDPYRSRITVVDTTTAGMSSDYSTTVMCTSQDTAPDAVYKFTPSLGTDVTVTVTPQGSGLTTPKIAVFDGAPESSALAHDLDGSGNLNEALSSAEPVSVDGAAQIYYGNTSAMTADVDASLLSCGAYRGGHDAVFSFHLDKSTSVEIDASASSVTDPVINLFRSSPLARPTQVTLENDSKQDADLRPAPTAKATASWLYYGADMAHLSAETQTQLSVSAVNSD